MLNQFTEKKLRGRKPTAMGTFLSSYNGDILMEFLNLILFQQRIKASKITA